MSAEGGAQGACGAGCDCEPCTARAWSPPPSAAPTWELEMVLRRLGRRVLELHRVQERYAAVWRRDEVDGEVVHELGSPLVYQAELGMFAPLDDEAAALADGLYEREDADWADDAGRRHRRQRIGWRPRVPPAEVSEPPRGSLGAAGPIAPRGSPTGEASRWWIVLRDTGEVRVPGRTACGAAWTELGRVDRLSPLRRERMRARFEVRRRAWDRVQRVLLAWGGEVLQPPRGSGRVALAALDAAAVSVVRDLPEVEVLSRAVAGVPDDSYGAALSVPQLCVGVPNLVVGAPPDSAECVGFGTPGSIEGPLLMLGHQAAILGTQAYLDEGYTGAGVAGKGLGRSAAGGLAPWALSPELVAGGYWTSSTTALSATIVDDVPHLVIATVEEPYLPSAVFQNRYDSEPRVLVVVQAGNSAEPARLLWGADVEVAQRVELPDNHAHGLATMAIAMGNVTDGTDPLVLGRSEQAARSGIARRAMGVGVRPQNTVALLEALVSVQAAAGVHDWSDMWEHDGLGVDVITDSVGVNSAMKDDGTEEEFVEADKNQTCPTADEARGLSAVDRLVVEAYCDSGVVFAKSAGNVNPGIETCAVTTQISTPSASPAAISVGAAGANKLLHKNDVQMSAGTCQENPNLYSASARGRTADGRTIPMVVVHADFCGAQYQQVSYDTDPDGLYAFFGATSAAAPQVAGIAVLFKHWYLDQHGAGVANQPGRVISNVLNFADGRVPNPPSPEEGWGLGAVRMRLFENATMGPAWKRATTSMVFDGATSCVVHALGRGEEGGWMAGASRLRITAWWLEVNTGAGEAKAAFSFHLYGDDWPLVPLLEVKKSGDECFVRIEYDCHRLGTELPGQHLYLAVYGKAEPEVRYPNRTSRTVYVSYFWETGPDPSLIDCHGAQECASATPAVPPPLPEITFAEAQLHLAVVEAQLCAYARQTRSPPALAAVQPTRAAQRQPNPEPR